ncbi:MAG TPA: hypothetical protein VJM11_06355 [Nevskiaceae bacterium]|nr:hypothetical protein [Nevskiaceae bacterium]
MKLSLVLCTLVVCLALTSPTVEAQGCPYTVSITSYGSACSNLTTSLPSLVGNFPMGGCDVGFHYDVPRVCCNVQLTHRFMIIGLAPASQPLPGGGCPLLVDPLLIVDLFAPFEGLIALQLHLPPNPALVGLSVYVQGVDRRFDTIAGTQHFETTNGLQLAIQ